MANEISAQVRDNPPLASNKNSREQIHRSLEVCQKQTVIQNRVSTFIIIQTSSNSYQSMPRTTKNNNGAEGTEMRTRSGLAYGVAAVVGIFRRSGRETSEVKRTTIEVARQNTSARESGSGGAKKKQTPVASNTSESARGKDSTEMNRYSPRASSSNAVSKDTGRRDHEPSRSDRHGSPWSGTTEEGSRYGLLSDSDRSRSVSRTRDGSRGRDPSPKRSAARSPSVHSVGSSSGSGRAMEAYRGTPPVQKQPVCGNFI